MALKIRMSRGGAKKRPYYRIVIADSRYPRDGRFIERIGSYDPMLPKDGERVKIDIEKAKEWYAKGARPTDRVARFLSEIDPETFSWTASNNPNKGKPGQKAQERITEREEREAEKKAAAEEAAAAEKEAAESPAEEDAPAAEAAAEEAPAEDAPAEEAKAEDAGDDEKKDA